jgi:tetratricopeptide (TPR) repeat protein
LNVEETAIRIIGRNLAYWQEQCDRDRHRNFEHYRQSDFRLQRAVQLGLDTEEHLLAAIKLLLLLWDAIDASGHWQRWEPFYARCAGLEAIQGRAEAADIRNRLGFSAALQNKVPEAINHFNAGLALSESLEHPAGQFDSLMGLAMVYHRDNQQDLARQQAQAALALLEGSTERDRARAAILTILGLVKSAQGHLAQAEADFRQVLAIREKLGIRHETLRALNNLGDALIGQQKLMAANAVFEQAQRLIDKSQNSLNKVFFYNNFGTLRYRMESYREAEILFFQIDRGYLKRNGHWLELGRSLQNLGSAIQVQERHDEAIEYLLEADALFEQEGDNLLSGYSKEALALSYRANGRLEEALQHAQQAVASLRDYQHQSYIRAKVADIQKDIDDLNFRLS